MQYQLNIAGFQFEILQKHLFPGDEKEAVAIALCGTCDSGTTCKLMVHELYLIPYADCSIREPNKIKWGTNKLPEIFEKARLKKLSVLKIHSHPNGYKQFSSLDDCSDKEFFSSTYGWVDHIGPHASAVMLPDGQIFGRIFLSNLSSLPMSKVMIVGDEIKFYPEAFETKISETGRRTAQAFGNKTFQILKNLKIGIVGCSGTGSPVIEQLVRLGVKELVIVDPDKIEFKNLNRILNTSIEDVITGRYKVDVAKESIERIGLGTKVTVHKKNLFDNVEVLMDLADCDFLFGCMDSVDGRHLLNQLATFYIVPYIDLGVKLEADGQGGISKICGSTHYLQPGKSSLLSRGVYNLEDLKAAGQLRKNPEEFHNLLKNAYIKNINVDRPAVISVNMLISSIAVNEFLNRIHPFKSGEPKNYAVNTIDLTENYIVNSNEEDKKSDLYLIKKVGRGTMNPFLDTPELTQKKCLIG